MSEYHTLDTTVDTATDVKITVTVHDKTWSGTDEEIRVKFLGDNGATGWMRIDDPDVDDFEHDKDPSTFNFEIGESLALATDPGSMMLCGVSIARNEEVRGAGSDIDAIQLESIKIERFGEDGTCLSENTFPFFNAVLGDDNDGTGVHELTSNVHTRVAVVNVGPIDDMSFATMDNERVTIARSIQVVTNTTDSEVTTPNDGESLTTTVTQFTSAVRAKSTSDSFFIGGEVSGAFAGFGASVSSSSQTTDTESSEFTITNQARVEQTITRDFSVTVAAKTVRMRTQPIRVNCSVDKAGSDNTSVYQYLPIENAGPEGSWSIFDEDITDTAEAAYQALSAREDVQNALGFSDISGTDAAQTAAFDIITQEAYGRR